MGHRCLLRLVCLKETCLDLTKRYLLMWFESHCALLQIPSRLRCYMSLPGSFSSFHVSTVQLQRLPMVNSSSGWAHTHTHTHTHTHCIFGACSVFLRGLVICEVGRARSPPPPHTHTHWKLHPILSCICNMPKITDFTTEKNARLRFLSAARESLSQRETENCR